MKLFEKIDDAVSVFVKKLEDKVEEEYSLDKGYEDLLDFWNDIYMNGNKH